MSKCRYCGGYHGGLDTEAHAHDRLPMIPLDETPGRDTFTARTFWFAFLGAIAGSALTKAC